jgi:HAD superfamily hydrolase (TIGR01509 family)
MLGTAQPGPYAGGVSQPEACLVDVYETLLTCDFGRHWNELPALAGVPERAWRQELLARSPALTVGQLSTAGAYAEMLRVLGASSRPGLLDELIRTDRELLLASARLFDDTIWFLETIRRRNIKIAIVSNCRENTRGLLTKLGVTALADAIVLSCEAGYAKPAPEIFQQALDQLGVTASAAVFIDDQAPYCAGAAELGITAVQITRPDGQPPGHARQPANLAAPRGTEPATVASLREAAAMIIPAYPLSGPA